MKPTTCVMIGFLMAACASSGRHGSGGPTVVTFKGPPPVVVTVPERVTEDQLRSGIPPIRVDGAPDVQASLVLFDDRDDDGEVDAGESTIRFRALQDERGLVVSGVRLTPGQVQALGRHKKFGVEVIRPGSGKREFFAREID